MGSERVGKRGENAIGSWGGYGGSVGVYYTRPETWCGVDEETWDERLSHDRKSKDERAHRPLKIRRVVQLQGAVVAQGPFYYKVHTFISRNCSREYHILPRITLSQWIQAYQGVGCCFGTICVKNQHRSAYGACGAGAIL